MKTTIRIFQPWTACLLLICGCLSAFGQSAPNFNVTVTQTSTGGQGTDWRYFSLPVMGSPGGDEQMEVVAVCIGENPDNPAYLTASIDVTFVLSETEPNIGTNYRMVGKVFTKDHNQHLVPHPLFTPGILGTLVSTGNTALGSPGATDANFNVTLSLSFDYIAPVNNAECQLYFTFGLESVNPISPLHPLGNNSVYFTDEIAIPVCDCNSRGDQNTQRPYQDNTSSSSTGRGREHSMDTSLEIYPNPFNNNIVLDLQNLSSMIKDHEQLSVELFDLLGNKVYIEAFPSSLQHKVNLMNLSPGTYILLVKGESFQNSKKVIKY